MSNGTRTRINAAFDDELSVAPVPAGFRALSIRDAVAAPRRRSVQPQLLVIVATIVVIAVAVSFVIGSHLLRSTPLPAKPTGSTIPPTPRASAAMAYDAAHGNMVVFGGNAANGKPATNETWTWDGKYWTQHHPAVSPTPRQSAAMAYDAAHHDIVVYGGMEYIASSGKGGLSIVDDTWIWDGSQWHQLHPVHYPVFGFDRAATMQFDPVSRTVLLFGFTKSRTEAMTDIEAQTWSWNGTDWVQMHPANGPTTSGMMVSDGKRVLMIAPTFGPVGGRFITQTWTWDGSNWSLLHPATNLPPLTGAAAFDPVRGRVVLVTDQAPMNDTWTWDGANWARQHPSLQPLRAGYMAYMPSLKTIVAWGDIFAPDDNEMFAWDGNNWSVIEPGTLVASANNGKGVITLRMTPEEAATLVRSTVKNTTPVLLPTSLPSGSWDAFVQVTADDFNITYEDDQRDKAILLGIVVANPPPATGPNAQGSRVRFRNALAMKFGAVGYADYGVYDTTAPTSQRFLDWIEPGTASNPMLAGPGVPYFLEASGLTDQEFWQVANSLG